MKRFVLVALALLSSPALAETPLHPCLGKKCPEKVFHLGDRFMEATIWPVEELPLVASGECFHLASYLNPDTIHFGVMLIDRNDSGLRMGGSFGFFYPENPYKDLTLEQARDRFLNDGGHQVEIFPDYLFANLYPNNPPEKQWKYWYRKSKDSYFVKTDWGTDHTVICEMKKNAQQ